jgi:hypothetical protein
MCKIVSERLDVLHDLLHAPTGFKTHFLKLSGILEEDLGFVEELQAVLELRLLAQADSFSMD